MTEKERLEKIKEKLLTLLCKVDEQGNVEVNVINIFNDICFLIEQAEDKLVWKKQAESFNEWFSKAKDESERYREVIENIKQTSTDFRNGHLLDIQDSFFVDEIIAIINKLEESK